MPKEFATQNADFDRPKSFLVLLPSFVAGAGAVPAAVAFALGEEEKAGHAEAAEAADAADAAAHDVALAEMGVACPARCLWIQHRLALRHIRRPPWSRGAPLDRAVPYA